MAATVEGKIAETLMVHVATITGSVPTAYPNEAKDPDEVFPPIGSNGEALDYLDVDHLPNGYSFETISSDDTHQGILQVALMQGSGKGSVKAQDKAGEIADHFPKGKRLFGDGVTVTIQGRPVVGRPLQDEGGYVRTPVTINYIASETA